MPKKPTLFWVKGFAKYVSEKNAGNSVYDKFNSVTRSLADGNSLDDAFLRAFNSTAGVSTEFRVVMIITCLVSIIIRRNNSNSLFVMVVIMVTAYLQKN